MVKTAVCGRIKVSCRRPGENKDGRCVMNVKSAAEWVLLRACGPYRKSGSCEHPACTEAQEIHDLLISAVRIDDKDSTGRTIRGWLIPD